MPPDCVGRYLCTKASWRGKYRRIMCITPNAVITQHPDNLTITNTFLFTGESDIDGISAAPMDQNAEEQEFTLSARSDKKVPYSSFFVPLNSLCVPQQLHMSCVEGMMPEGLTKGDSVYAEQVQSSQVLLQAKGSSADSAVPVHDTSSHARTLPHCAEDPGVSLYHVSFSFGTCKIPMVVKQCHSMMLCNLLFVRHQIWSCSSQAFMRHKVSASRKAHQVQAQ